MAKKKEHYSHISFVLDRSGSMGGLVQDTLGGFNSFIEKQKEALGKATVSLYQFDHEFQPDYEFQNLSDVQNLTHKDYVPRGATSLNDAIGKAIMDTQAYLDKLRSGKKRRPDKVYVVTITDGEENSSKEFRDVSRLKKLIEVKQADKSVVWEFVFLGANLDAQKVASSYSIPMNNTVNYTANKIGTQAAYAALSTAMLRSRTVTDEVVAANFSFDDAERALLDNSK